MSKEVHKVTELVELPEGWEIVKLSQVGKIISGGTPDTKSSLNWNGGIPWCTPTDITSLKGKKYILKTNKTISDLGLKNSSATMLPKDSVIVCTRATIGDCAINKLPITTNQGFKSIVANENFNAEYLYYLINNIKDKIIKLSSGSTFLEISKKAFENIDFLAPPLPEQQKIASILSTVDEKIENIDTQISHTQELKKGLMQQLLTKGIGHTKFKSSEFGEIPESWELVKLVQVGNIISGGTPDTKNSLYWNGSIPWCTPTDITALKGEKKIIFTRKTVSELGLKASSATLLPANSLIVCTRATIGDCAINKFPMSTNQGFKSIVPNNNWEVDFLYYLINSIKDKIIQLSSGSTFLEISKKAFENISFYAPTFLEQQKIAFILSTVDEKITSLQTKKQAYQQLKKGLMQQLLTGKIRVQTSQTELSLT